MFWGGIAGYKGGRIDEYMMRIADVLAGIPYLLLVILLMVVLGSSVGTMILAMSITGWVNMAQNCSWTSSLVKRTKNMC